jgi:O-antigen/teichoic acid export membrane protein
MPEISRLSVLARDAQARIRSIYTRAVRLAVLGGLPLFAVAFAAATPLLRIWLRDGFDPLLTGTFRIMLGATLLSLFGAPAYHVVMGLGHVRSVFVSTLIQFVINIGVLLIFVVLGIPATPAIVAVAVLASMGAANSYLVWEGALAIRSIRPARA